MVLRAHPTVLRAQGIPTESAAIVKYRRDTARAKLLIRQIDPSNKQNTWLSDTVFASGPALTAAFPIEVPLVSMECLTANQTKLLTLETESLAKLSSTQNEFPMLEAQDGDPTPIPADTHGLLMPTSLSASCRSNQHSMSRPESRGDSPESLRLVRF